MCSQGASNGSISNSASSLTEAAAEAAEDYLPKASKLRQLRAMMDLQDWQILQRDDRDAVRRYRNKTVFGDSDPAHAQEPEMGDILIADNITIGAQPTPSAPSAPVSSGAGTEARPATVETAETPLWKKAAALAAVMAGTGGAAGLASYLTTQPAAKPPTIEVPVPPAYGVDVEKHPTTNSTEAAK